MMILGIDPGPTGSGWVILGTAPSVGAYTVHNSGTDDNCDLLTWVKHSRCTCPWWWRRCAGQRCDILAIETMLVTYGSKVGPSVMDTMRWAGKFEQHWLDQGRDADSVRLISRQLVKAAIGCSVKASDAGVRQALIDLLGPPGRKREPGPTYGVTGHAWAALAVAVAASRIAADARQTTAPHAGYDGRPAAAFPR
jgi:hypothetical protein